MQRFARLTKGHSVLMGRSTYESLPARFRPLPERRNIVASRGAAESEFPSGVHVCRDAVAFLKACKAGQAELPSNLLWIIGGARIYEATRPWWDEVELTLVRGRHPGDAFFPPFEEEFTLVDRQDLERCAFLRYQRVALNSTESQAK